ncbi:hypothetical protein BGLA2_950003 [Burkholderia gladioli]|nr:hypothetical protein BGLA2_950003 [Burkholderia gladioli]
MPFIRSSRCYIESPRASTLQAPGSSHECLYDVVRRLTCQVRETIRMETCGVGNNSIELLNNKSSAHDTTPLSPMPKISHFI